jgi:AcrR family transcriptional regulator
VRISKALGVTRQTVYNWFLGKEIFPAYRDRAEWLLKILQSSPNAEAAWSKVCKELNLEL